MVERVFSHESLSQKVVEYLRQEILLENLKAGERILEARIAKDLTISRAPVREAMKELENSGLVISIPRKGTFVVDLTEEEIQEIFDIRVMLELRIFEDLLKKKKLVEEDFLQMRAIVDEMVVIAGQKNIPHRLVEVNKKDIAFHRYLWGKSGRRWSMKMLLNLHNQLQLAMVIDSRREGDLVESAKKHYSIIEHLRNGDLEGVREALTAHIVIYRDTLKEDLMTSF